jgi:hypothetical protein
VASAPAATSASAAAPLAPVPIPWFEYGGLGGQGVWF